MLPGQRPLQVRFECQHESTKQIGRNDQIGVKRMRPFARRAWMTLRPLRVAMRVRNPWVRARLSRLG